MALPEDVQARPFVLIRAVLPCRRLRGNEAMISTDENQPTHVTNCYCATLFATGLTWNDLRSKQSICFEKSETKFLSHDRVCRTNLQSVPPSDNLKVFVNRLAFKCSAG